MKKINILRIGIIIVSVITIVSIGCVEEKQPEAGNIKLSSPAFENAESIPPKYTCDGADVSPPLNFSGIPENAESLALIMDDPDAPGSIWVHWIVYDIPNATTSLPENAGVEGDGNLPSGAKHGTNSWPKENDFYRGPCPPSGAIHRYYFKLYALDTILDLEPGATKTQLEEAMAGHIIEETQLMGTYG